MLRIRIAAIVRALRATLALVVIVAQLGMVATTVLEGRAGANARPHVESTGTEAHYAHCEDTCLVCAAQHSASCVAAHPPLPLVALTPSGSLAATDEALVGIAASASNQSRAPPTSI